MISINMKYSPIASTILKGGKYTRFAIPQFHRQNDVDVKDGLLNVITKGSYYFHRGDMIKIKKITGANVINRQYFAIFAEIEYISEEMDRAEPNSELLENDIPEDL